MISLVIKGNRQEAQKAADQHRVPIIINRELAHEVAGHQYTEIVAWASEDFLPQVASWFTEPGEAPFPAGTLLIYSLNRKFGPRRA